MVIHALAAAAAAADMSLSTLNRRFQAGTGSATIHAGRNRLVTDAALQAWLEMERR
jgi:hypothetical protein